MRELVESKRIMVTWDAAKLERFKLLIAGESTNSTATVVFDGHEFYVPYVEYLKGQLKGKQ